MDTRKPAAITKTKVACTLGPACDDPEIMRQMIRAGMDVARVNFSHGDHASHARRIEQVRRLADEEGRVLAILADLQGPKLRIGDIANGTAELFEGEKVTLSSCSGAGGPGVIPLPHPELIAAVQAGQRLLLDDGAIELEVESKTDTDLLCRTLVGGLLSSHKGVNVPGAAPALEVLTQKDREDVLFAIEQQVDYLAQSFVRRADDVDVLRSFLRARESPTPIIAKIEKAEALESFDGILAVADGVMIARGDLGVETGVEQVPIEQKRILTACNRAGKPAITATQMLQSMVNNPRPTRAEASDVANAVLDGTDVVMLSGETAVGKYPVEAVRVMGRIIGIAEGQLDPEVWVHRLRAPGSPSEAIARATVEIAVEVGAAAILTSTISGETARMVARYRPGVPVLAATPSAATFRRMALVWGVVPLRVPSYETTDAMFEFTTQAALAAGLVKRGDIVVITAGVPAGGKGKTNMLKVHVI